MTITLVSQGASGYARGTAVIASGTFTVTLQQAPVSGNLLILCFAGQGSTAVPYITGISQTNVTWTSQKVCPDSNIYQDTEIWAGVVSASAGTVITVTVAGGTGGMYGEIADVFEYSGLLTSGFLDKTAYNNGAESSSLDTGTTATTTQASELWIGCTGGVGSGGANPTQTTPTNAFTLYDGVKVATSGSDYSSLGCFIKIASVTGAADSGATAASSSTYWTGVIVTFIAATVTNINVSDSGSGSDVVAFITSSASDSGSGSDAAQIKLPISDSGSGSDVVTNINNKSSDSGSGSDVAQIGLPMAIAVRR